MTSERIQRIFRLLGLLWLGGFAAVVVFTIWGYIQTQDLRLELGQPQLPRGDLFEVLFLFVVPVGFLGYAVIACAGLVLRLFSDLKKIEQRLKE